MPALVGKVFDYSFEGPGIKPKRSRIFRGVLLETQKFGSALSRENYNSAITIAKALSVVQEMLKA